MPPIVFVEASALSEIDASHCGGSTPAHAQAGDVVLAAFGCFDARNADVTPLAQDIVIGGLAYHEDPSAWVTLSRQVNGSDVAMVMLHVVGDDEPAYWAIPLTGASTHPLQGALMLYRSIDAGRAVVEAGFTAIAASTVWNAPSRTLTAYSDLFLGVHYCRSAAAAITPAGSYTQRYHHESGGSSVLLADWITEATGATGAKNASTAGVQTGIVGSFAIASIPAIHPEYIDPTSTPGGIGFWGKLANE